MTITALPTPPTRQDPDNFSIRADQFFSALPAFATEANALATEVNANKNITVQASNQAQDDRVLTQAAAAAVANQQPIANAARAEQAAVLAETYASQAQATNPDSPIRLNPRHITANFTVPSNYNAGSTGPLYISEAITVTVQDFATWSIT